MADFGDFNLEILRIVPQPDFPKTDLTDTNAEILSLYVLPTDPSIATHASYLMEHQKSIYNTALSVLKLEAHSDRLDPFGYQAFCLGFAAFEFISLSVRPRLYDMQTATRQALALYLRAGVHADLELWERHSSLTEAKANTFNTIKVAGEHRRETVVQLKARALGAQIACELQLPTAA